ncbi:hypothetical protein FEM48_Zijuj09G0109300 [Ziziphus jujuba var. spinosa]|uniref:DUF7086 domain-containing protein n=1 Tax=Ziziphus jujuba var. spinosa TaxID=714518 RepID=A0A978USL4_ZIZJJ|nr:hypothetical protein FEM48_Zijuj09G0109300 [Ziziphus jujuba var. spinosa]
MNNNDEEEMNNAQEINRKRKNNQDSNQDHSQITTTKFSDEEENDMLTLSLQFPPSRPRPPPPVEKELPPAPPPPPPPRPLSMQALLVQNQPQFPLHLSAATHTLYGGPPPPPPPTFFPAADYTTQPSSGTYLYRQQETTMTGPSSRSTRVRRNPTQAPREGKSETIPAPFPWATTHRATVHTLDYLVEKQILTVNGDVQCKRCERQYEMEFDLREKFHEVGCYIVKNKCTMHDRAPSRWLNPNLPACKYCEQENCVKPIISEKKKSINWLFLLLGQMLGCCTLEQLKYFCKHTKNHRTGAKDRVLYLTYLGLCKQLDPTGPFDR